MPEKLLYDFLATLEGGINSDPATILLPKNVAAWTINSTLRGGFAKPRPPIFLRAPVYPNADVQAVVETGFYQGGGFYRPDFGDSQLVAQISGRLFAFSINANVVIVSEITVPGDPNDATTGQVWMWQAEKWLIITDGSAKLPIFYDGVISRRSSGPSVLLGTVSAVDLAGPNPIGTVITATLTTAYTGAYNVAVLFNGEYYQTVVNSAVDPDGNAVYDAIISSIGSPAGVLVPAGADVVVQPGFLGQVTTNQGASFMTLNEPCDPGPFGGNSFLVYYTVTLTVPRASASLMDQAVQVRFYNPQFPQATQVAWTVTGGTDLTTNSSAIVTRTLRTLAGCFVRNGGVFQGFNPALNTGGNIHPGSFILDATNTSPQFILGKTAAAFTTPGAPTVIQLTAPYTGTPNQLVWINNVPYTLSQATTTPVGGFLSLINLSDTQVIPFAPEFGFDLEILSVPELPAGRMGAYGLGHVAMSLVDGISFIYGDAVGGPSGTQATNYRDSVLRTTENTFMVGGGSFRIPNSGEIITSITFTAILDAAYGQGPLLLGTPTAIFSCDVPTDRALWIALTNPILTEVLIGKGPLAQNSTIPANSDTLFRTTEGLGSLIFGRRDFETWGNTPISSEMNRTVSRDLRSLLSYGSGVTFDNRYLSTAAPQVSTQGVFHIGTLALNFDPVSSLRGKAPSIWESLWVGTNVLQYIVGRFGPEERCFQFTFNQIESKIELYEQLRTDGGEYFDNGTDRIEWVVETPCIFKPEARSQDIPMVRLMNGKLHLSEIVGRVHIKVQYRPDFWPCWVDWHEFDLCATVDPENPNSHPGYRTPVGLGEPSPTPCEAANNRPMRSARFFQLRLEFTGQCVFMGGEFAAVPEPTINFPAPHCDPICD